MTDVTARLEVEIDGSEAVAEASRLERSIDALKGKAGGLDGQLSALKRGADSVAGGLSKAGSGASNTARAIEQMRTSTVGAVREMGGLARATEDLGTAAARASAGMAGLASSATANTQALARKRAAMQQLGVQFGDFATQVSLGANVFQAFGAQAGQAAAAATGLGGAAGRVAGFFASPWGAALTLGITVLGTLASKLWDTKDAAEEAEKAAADFAKRQSDIGNFIDATTGKLIEQNKTLVQNAILLKQAKIEANDDRAREAREAAMSAARGARVVNASAEDQLGAERGGGLARAGIDPAVAKVIADAKGNVEALDRGFQALAKRRPELKGIALEISNQAAAAVDAQRENQKLGKDIDALNGKSGASFEALSNKIAAETNKVFAVEEQFRQREADIERRLTSGGKDRISEKQAADELRAAYADRAAGLKKIEDAEDARRKAASDARKEERAAAKAARDATREAARDAREAQSAYAGLVSSFDSVAAAGLRYAGRLEDIKKAVDAGLITEEQAGVFALAAAEEQAEALARPLRDLEERYDKVAAATNRYRDALKDIDKAQAQGLATDVADRYRNEASKDYTRDRIRAIADDVADMVAAREDIFGKAADGAVVRMRDRGDDIGAAIGAAFGKKAGEAARGIVAAINAAKTGDASGVGEALGGKVGSFVRGYDALFGGKDAAGKPNNPLAKSIGKELDKSFAPFKDVFKDVKGGLDKVLGGDGTGAALEKLAGQIGAGIKIGGFTDDVLDSLGIKSNATGAKIGGTIGKMTGIPGMDFALAAVGGIIGGMLAKSRKSSINLSTDAEGDFTTGGLRGQGKGSGKRKAATEELGSGFGDALKELADAFGTGLAKGINLGSLGTREDKFTFDPSGQGRTKKKFGAQQFGTQEEAVAAAIRNAIDKGVIQGIRESTKRLLAAGGDFEAALDKAVKFENVFKELEQRKDPTGFALKELDKELAELRDIFKEAGASAEEYAQLEELFQLKRKDIMEEGQQATLDAMAEQVASMKDYLRQLQGGPGLGLSPQNRLINARSEFEKLDADRLAGKAVDFDMFRSVADNFLDASRGFNGSTTAYFTDLQKVITATQGFIDKAQAAAATSPTVAPVVDAITQTGAVTNALLQQVVQALGQQIVTANDNAETIALAAAGGGQRGVDARHVKDF